MATPSAPAPKEFALHHGHVKQVLSGDTVVIRGQSRGGPPPERTISLSGISAPRLARRPNQKDPSSPKDEPFAWESREFLRKKLLGKEVSFTVEYKVPSGREFGTVFVGPSKENVTQSLVQEGLVAVRLREGGKGPLSQEQQDLAQIAATAQSAHKGIHGTPDQLAATVRDIAWNPENLRAIVDGAKGKPVDAIVENVRDGCTLRVFLLPSFQNVTVVLTGIKTPGFKHVDGKEIPEPLAEEAKFFTEVRLLQRDVKIVLEGVSGQNLLGTVLHPAGNISEFLLEQGYAKIVDWSFGYVSNGRERLRASEAAAKLGHLRLWADHRPSEKAVIADRDYTATVEEIVSPECIIVNHGGTSKKLFLSSIRQPRPPKDDGAAAAPAASAAGGRKRLNFWEIPWMLEAREFMRKKLIGHKVQVHIDFVKPASDGFPDRTCATVKVDDVNIAEALVSKGLANVIRYKESEEDRASGYDDLLAAETRASKNLKGIHSTKDIPVHRINDVSTRAVAEKLLASFSRAGRLSAVVEHVQSGSRLRVFIAKESCMITLLLAGLSCPRSGGGDKPSEPFGDDALALTRSHALQREVEVEFEDIDKTGCFVGHLFVDGSNLSIALLTNGFAKTHPSSERYKYASQLAVAQAGAKDSRKNIWADYVEPVAAAPVEAPEREPRARKTEYQPVVVTDIANAVSFSAQAAGAATQLDHIMGTIANAFAAAPPSALAAPKRNELVAARFSVDKQWYRAKITKINGPGDYTVLYVDFGNSENVGAKDIAALPPGLSGAGLASEYQFAFISAPPGDWASDALDYLKERVLNRRLNVNVEYRDGAAEFVTVVEEDTNVDIGKDLLEEGLVIFKNRTGAHLQPLMKEYAAAQQRAKSKRVGIWVYGDISEDDAKEFGRGGKP